MSSLQNFRTRITSVKSTHKVTSAMKMVAASKLRRAQAAAETSRPYSDRLALMLAAAARDLDIDDFRPPLLYGSGADRTHLLVVVTSDKGLCGGFNANLIRFAKEEMRRLVADGKTVTLLAVGRKGREALQADHKRDILHEVMFPGGALDFSFAEDIADWILTRFDEGAFDICSLVFSRFHSVLSQEPEIHRILPFDLPEAQHGALSFDFEPNQRALVEALLPRNFRVQLYQSILESVAGEHAARMNAMDSATRNAEEMLDDLTLSYNRARQASITSDLIEIISGAEAL
ncbi:MAG: F0F1 ATP synthase subunit gamma [Pseudomonadota bacterium]|nr:F0F1 ATP synthase subunit gamma [Pseudomonadota bacterium]